MFCPKCSQQQPSDGVRFCSRCGFQLEVVKELLLTDGVLAWPEAETPARGRSARNRGIRQGAMLMLLTGLFVPLTAVLARAGMMPRAFIGMAAIICAVGGFMRLIYAIMFEEGAPRVNHRSPPLNAPAVATPAQVRSGHVPNALPPQRSRPASEFNRWRAETAEMAQPPSVTENTTRLLDDAPED